jgi:hypothetical protein
MLMLIDQAGMKMGMRMKLDEEQYTEEAQNQDIKVTKTGKSKEILGYSCDEYEVTSKSAYMLVWITEELELPDFYRALAASNPSANYLKGFPEGFLMEMKMWPEGKQGSQSVEMEVTALHLDHPNEISTAGYQIMEMPNR